MNDFVIVTDSASDLSPQLIEMTGVKVIPMAFTLKDQEYSNDPLNPGMDTHAFYDALRAGQMATTAAINSTLYEDALAPYLEDGSDVLLLVFSSGLSTTYQAAVIAADELNERFPQRRVVAVDSLAASMGQGLLAFHAARLQKEGKTLDEVRDWLLENRNRLCHWFTVDDLHFLKRGGRVSSATALVGTMLSIKPVLHVDDEGHLISMSKARGRRAALTALADRMADAAVEPAGQTVFVSHGDCEDDARFVAELVRQRFGVKDIYINSIGHVIGAHSGPGTVALFFLGTRK